MTDLEARNTLTSAGWAHPGDYVFMRDLNLDAVKLRGFFVEGMTGLLRRTGSGWLVRLTYEQNASINKGLSFPLRPKSSLNSCFVLYTKEFRRLRGAASAASTQWGRFETKLRLGWRP